LSDRDFELWVRNADDHKGEKLVIYGEVFQFDTVTGPSAFLADVAGTEQDYAYEYDITASVAAASEELLADVVEDDIVKMWVVGAGTYTYDTAMGGQNTVPLFLVTQIEVIEEG
jgi:hypothetical protein